MQYSRSFHKIVYKTHKVPKMSKKLEFLDAERPNVRTRKPEQIVVGSRNSAPYKSAEKDSGKPVERLLLSRQPTEGYKVLPQCVYPPNNQQLAKIAEIRIRYPGFITYSPGPSKNTLPSEKVIAADFDVLYICTPYAGGKCTNKNLKTLMSADGEVIGVVHCTKDIAFWHCHEDCYLPSDKQLKDQIQRRDKSKAFAEHSELASFLQTRKTPEKATKKLTDDGFEVVPDVNDTELFPELAPQ